MEKTKKSSDPWARSGRGLAGDMGLNFLFFWFFHGFLQFGQKPREHKKKSSDPWARSELTTHKPKNQKTKKPRNQKTKKPKNQKKQKKQDCTPQGEGVRCRVLGLVFLFFLFFVFLFFWFFGLDSHCRCAKQRLPGTVSGCTRGRAGKNQKTKKTKNQKTKKPKNKKTKKPKNQKTKKNKKKTRLHTPRGGGQMQSVGSCLFVFLFFFVFFFVVFLFFWFFVFLVFWFVCG